MFRNLILIIVSFISFFAKLNAQTLQANAGPDIYACQNSTVVLGTAVPATGGTPPYFYSWSPTTGLNSASIANPTLSVTAPTLYTLTVRDSNDSIATDVVFVNVPNLLIYTTGKDTAYCPGLSSNIPLGNPINSSATGITFSWSPSAGLNNPTAPNPVANPTTSTVYSLTVSNGSCAIQTGTVNVLLAGISISLTFKDTTIKEGTTISLYANSPNANVFYWTPQNGTIHYQNTSSPEVYPTITTTYTLMAKDSVTGCFTYDTVRVNVIPDDDLVFYSAFTPNSDGDNDFFYIGNIFKYPDNILKVYNRYGQVVYTSAGYKNDWDGSYQGNKLPTGTYFYILDSGTEKGKYTGSVTILR